MTAAAKDLLARFPGPLQSVSRPFGRLHLTKIPPWRMISSPWREISPPWRVISPPWRVISPGWAANRPPRADSHALPSRCGLLGECDAPAAYPPAYLRPLLCSISACLHLWPHCCRRVNATRKPKP
eukprot:4340600-Pyramimonas_sp.AAC.2